MCVGSLDWNVKHLSGQDIGGSDDRRRTVPSSIFSQSGGVLPRKKFPVSSSDTLQNIWKIAGYTNCALSSSAKSAGRLSDIRRMESFASCLTVYPTLSQFQAADYDSIEDETLYDFNEIYSSGMVSLLNKQKVPLAYLHYNPVLLQQTLYRDFYFTTQINNIMSCFT